MFGYNGEAFLSRKTQKKNSTEMFGTVQADTLKH